MIKAHYYNQRGETIIDLSKIDDCDAEYFKRNNIKVSLEEINNNIIAYACPYSDDSEESEVLVIAYNEEPCEQVMAQLVQECRQAFGDVGK
jgi:hypothetical protein